MFREREILEDWEFLVEWTINHSKEHASLITNYIRVSGINSSVWRALAMLIDNSRKYLTISCVLKRNEEIKKELYSSSKMYSDSLKSE